MVDEEVVATHEPSTNVDMLTWDALGRLISDQRTSSSANFTWSAIYDGLGRRLQTIYTPSGGTAVILQQSYDPDVKFMELAVTVVGGTRDWLVHGPDLNGIYGGLNGTGGIEAVINDSNKVTTGLVSDTYGHTEATVTGGTNLNWNLVRSSGYGPQPGTSASPLDPTHDLATVLAWRGHYIDPTGFYHLGARYYEPTTGTFLSCDPLGHAASIPMGDCNPAIAAGEVRVLLRMRLTALHSPWGITLEQFDKVQEKGCRMVRVATLTR